MSNTEILALTAIGLTIITNVINLTWGASQISKKVEEKFTEKLEDYKAIVAIELKRLGEAIIETEQTMSQRTGEVGNALRDKITQVEFFVRDTYVEKDDLKQIISMMDENMKMRFDLLQSTVNRLADRLDRPPTPA